jgi:hypothetical protein
VVTTPSARIEASIERSGERGYRIHRLNPALAGALQGASSDQMIVAMPVNAKER